MTRFEHDVAKCEWCGHPLTEGDEEPMHEGCYREQEAEWRIEHAKLHNHGA